MDRRQHPPPPNLLPRSGHKGSSPVSAVGTPSHEGMPLKAAPRTAYKENIRRAGLEMLKLFQLMTRSIPL